jgi:hypothetical protein
VQEMQPSSVLSYSLVPFTVAIVGSPGGLYLTEEAQVFHQSSHVQITPSMVRALRLLQPRL